MLSAIDADHYPVEHWLLGRSRIPADERPPSTSCLQGTRSPQFTDRFLRDRPDSHYFVLRERPFVGSVPVTPTACHSACVFRVELSSSSGFQSPGCRRTAHPVRAPVGRLFPLCRLCGISQRGDLTPACAVQPLENSKASTSIFVLQATKSQRRMPWRLKPKKDVGDCEKPREAVYQASIRGYPNGATQHLS